MRGSFLAFVIAAGCTKEPEDVSTADVRVDRGDPADDPDSLDPEMCVAPDASVYVMWIDDRDGAPAIWLNRSLNRGGVNSSGWADPSGWLPAAVKVNHSEAAVANAALACDDFGVYVVWQDDRDGILQNGQVYFNRSVDKGETFSPEDMLIDGDPGGESDALEPSITISGEDLYVSWYDNRAGTYDVYLATSEDSGQVWRSPVRVEYDDPGRTWSGRPSVGVSGSGDDVWVAWQDLRDGAADIYFALSDTRGADFEPDMRIDEGDDGGAYDSFSPKVCADPDGWVYVVWEDARDGEGLGIYANYSDDGGESWLSNSIRLDSDNAGFANSIDPQCIASGSRATVVWTDDRLGGYDIYTRDILSGLVTPELEQRLDTGTPEGFANSLHPRMSSHSGNLAVAWIDERDVRAPDGDRTLGDLYYNVQLNGQPFLPEDDLRIDSFYAGESARVGMDIAVLGGELYATWADDRDGTWDIWFQRLPLGERSDPLTRDPSSEEAEVTQ